MSQALIRHLRLFCASPNAVPVRQKDGVLAVAGVLERAGLARLLLVDMERWGRNPGASVTNAIDRLVPAAHRYLIGGFGIALADTLIVEWDGSGHSMSCAIWVMGAACPIDRCMARNTTCGLAVAKRSSLRPAQWGARCCSGPRRSASATGRGSKDDPARAVRDVRALGAAGWLDPAGGRRMRLARRSRRPATFRCVADAVAGARTDRSPGWLLPRTPGGQVG
jgi:hypothetical protein